MKALRRATPHPEVTLAMVKADGDLRALRSDPRFEKWLAELVAIEEAAESSSEETSGGDGADSKRGGGPRDSRWESRESGE